MMARICIFALCFFGCDEAPPGTEYYDQVIQPILTTNCVRNQGACHKDDGQGHALGNLDLSSYDSVARRRDVLRTYGSYPEWDPLESTCRHASLSIL